MTIRCWLAGVVSLLLTTACVRRPAAAPVVPVQKLVVSDARVLLPADLAALLHVDFVRLRRSPHYPALLELAQRALVQPTAERSAIISETLGHADQLFVGARLPTDADNPRMETLAVWRGPLTEVDMAEILADFRTPPTARSRTTRHSSTILQQGAEQAASFGDRLWLVGKPDQIDATFARLRADPRALKPDEWLGSRTHDPLRDMAKRIDMESGAATLAVDLRSLGTLWRDIAQRLPLSSSLQTLRSLGVKVQLQQTLGLQLIAVADDESAATALRDASLRLLVKARRSPLLMMLGLSAALDRVEVRAEANAVHLTADFDAALLARLVERLRLLG